MVKIPSNFRGKGTGEEMCVTGCGEIETMKHLYTCSRMKDTHEQTHSYDKIYNGYIKEKVEIFKIMKKHIQKRKQIEEKII